MTDIADFALLLLGAGFSVIPVNADKTPAVPTWKEYQLQAMSPEAAVPHFVNGARLAIVGGRVSGNLECLDFDDPGTFEPFLELLEMQIPNLPTRLYRQTTPRGGFHLVYRCNATVAGNQKLACDQAGMVRIETRGEGGYFLAAPSPGYQALALRLQDCPVLTGDEVNAIHAVARSFDERPTEPAQQALSVSKPGGNNANAPGTAFNRAVPVADLLTRNGWRLARRATAGQGWTRPGKESGVSGVLLDATGNFYVFSSNASPLEAMRSYDAFGLFAAYEHGGNFGAAAKSLAAQGYIEWPDPQPLTAKIKPEGYPVDALPGTIRAAVEEVQGFTKAPMALVASSALAALSVAAQAHIDVKRADLLTGPVGLFLLTIADSGERKSTCDNFFAKALREYQKQQVEAAKPGLMLYNAGQAAWEAKRSGVTKAIQQTSKQGKDTSEKERVLQELEASKPIAPKVPKLLRGDDTPENLAWSLAREWPSAGVLSSEAGLILGAHGMGKDSIMRNLGLLNVLWDGGALDIGRRTSESFTVRGARLTVALQVQEATLQSFLKGSGGLARGTGFLARFLVAWPESTQGYRPFEEAPECWPSLEAFNQRIAALLEVQVNMDEDGALEPAMMMLSPEAKAAWVAFHDRIEGELWSGGQLYDVRDVASKAADNAARLAALFQVFEHGMDGAVGEDALRMASRIVSWHLNESRHFFGELALPDELTDAVRLDRWLIDHCRKNGVDKVPTKTVQQFGPATVRRKASMDIAMRELEELDRAREEKDGRRKFIKLNPALLADEDGAVATAIPATFATELKAAGAGQ